MVVVIPNDFFLQVYLLSCCGPTGSYSSKMVSRRTSSIKDNFCKFTLFTELKILYKISLLNGFYMSTFSPMFQYGESITFWALDVTYVFSTC